MGLQPIEGIPGLIAMAVKNVGIFTLVLITAFVAVTVFFLPVLVTVLLGTFFTEIVTMFIRRPCRNGEQKN